MVLQEKTARSSLTDAVRSLGGEFLPAGRRMRGRRLWIILISIFLISLALRIPNYSKQPVMPDEVTFFQRFAFTIIEEGWRWPVKYMYIHPPLIPFILSFTTLVFGGSLEVLRLTTVMFGALTPVFIFLLGRELYGSREGMLAAMLMAFSGFHILYSRVLMLEVPMLFFLTVGSYLFIKGLHEREATGYAVGAGIFLGFAIITKWVALLFVPSFLLFMVVAKRSLRCLFERRVLLVFAISGLVTLPCVIDLWIHGVNPIYRNFGIGTPPIIRLVGIEEIWLPDLATRGIENFLEMSMDAGSQAAEMLPWRGILILIGGVVFIATMANAVYGWARGREEEAFLFSLFLVFAAFVAIYGKRFQYYLIWLLPTYLILVSGALMRLARFVSNGRVVPRFVSAASLVLSFLLILSYITTGILAPFVNGGPTFGYDDQVRALRPGLSRSNIIAASFPEVVDHYLEEFRFETFENEVLVLPLNRKILSPIGIVEEFDLRIISILAPKFIITARYYFDQLAGSKETRAINEKYRLVSEVGEVLLFERTSR